MNDLKEVVAKVEEEVKKRFDGEGTGHDWWHIDRVRRLSVNIAKEEGADLFVVELAALLHDVTDHKLFDGTAEEGRGLLLQIMAEAGCDDLVAEAVLGIIDGVSYKGAGVEDIPLPIEGQVVRDADRLDAMGAIGIARAFAFGGSRHRLLYDPTHPPVFHSSFAHYRQSQAPTINHFYEKLLLLKDRLQTPTALKMALHRHQFMEQFLNEFYAEWEGER